MSSEMDKFVLQYNVELKDSISRLEKLQEKVAGVGKGAKSSVSEVKKFAGDAADELGKLVPGMSAVGNAVRAMGAEFAVAGAAIAILAIGVKSVIDLRNQYAAQRSLGMEIGVSGARVEDYQRKFVEAGQGRITREQAAAGLSDFRKQSATAYADPASVQARRMKALGVNVGQYGKAPTGFNDQLTQMASGLKGKSDGEIQALAEVTGQSKDWLLALKELGPTIGKASEQTMRELEQRKKSEADMLKLNTDLAKFSEAMTELEQKLAVQVLPALTKFIHYLSETADWMNKIAPDDPNKSIAQKQRDAMSNLGGWIKDKVFGKKAGPGGVDGAPDESEAERKRLQASSDNLDKMDETNKTAVQTADQMGLAINQFAGAVQSFSGAVSTQQAWAAWAGEIGKRSLGGSGNGSGGSSPGAGGAPASGSPSVSGKGASRGIRNNNPGNIEYGAFAKSQGATGTDGRFAIFPSMEAGTAAHVALLGGSGYMGAGLNTPAAIVAKYAPASENNQKAYLAAIKSGSGFGPDQKLTAADLPKLAAAMEVHESGYRGGSGTAAGESRTTLQKQSVQQALASYLHVPLEQIQQGGVSKGDADWASSQMEAGIRNNIWNLKRQASVGGMPQQTYAKLQTDIRDQSRGLDLMKQYAPGIDAQQREGGRSLTIGERAIIINVNGSADPEAVGQEVNDRMAASINELLNNYATGTKG